MRQRKGVFMKLTTATATMLKNGNQVCNDDDVTDKFPNNKHTFLPDDHVVLDVHKEKGII